MTPAGWLRSLPLVLAGWLGSPAWALDGAPVRFCNRTLQSLSLTCLEVDGTQRPAQCSELWVRAGDGPARRMFPADEGLRQAGGILTLPAGKAAVFTMVFPDPGDGTDDLTDHFLLRADFAGGSCTLIYTAAVFRDPASDPVAGGVIEEHAAGSEPGPAVLEHPSLAGGILDKTTLVYRGPAAGSRQGTLPGI